MKRLMAVTIGLGLAGAAWSAAAETATGQMAVQSEVTATCTISATDMVFAGYSQTANTDATSTVSVQCTGTSGTLTFTVDNGGSFETTRRLVYDTTNFLSYQIATTSGGTDLEDTDDVDVAVSPSTGAGTTTLHGRIPSGQGNKPAGLYTDSVTLTLTY